jgi:hypothetical protein
MRALCNTRVISAAGGFTNIAAPSPKLSLWSLV